MLCLKKINIGQAERGQITMQIGQVIRQYRKEKEMTQEEMANRLGVTAPAVNKWENGGSMPDIMLLAPIARLLGISLDTLLSFREELTQEEIQDIIYTLNSKLREQSFEEAFAYAKEKMEQYPNCEALLLEAAVLLNAGRAKREDGGENERQAEEKCGMSDDIEQGSPEEEYDAVINGWLKGALRSKQEQIRIMAADALFSFHLRNEEYEKAEECLAYYSEQNPERKRRQALIYSRTNRRQEAYKTYEELLFSTYQMANLLFGSILMLAEQDGNREKVRKMVDKQSALAEIFEMGEYHKISNRLELAMMEKDGDAAVTIMKQLLASIDDINHFTKSSLYEHMTFREIRPEFVAQIREDLLKSFRKSFHDEACGFLNGDAGWEEFQSYEIQDTDC